MNTLDSILQSVCERHMISPDEMRGKTKHKAVSDARAAYAAQARLLTDCSYPEIGRHIKKHHTTIILAERRALAWTAEKVAEVL